MNTKHENEEMLGDLVKNSEGLVGEAVTQSQPEKTSFRKNSLEKLRIYLDDEIALDAAVTKSQPALPALPVLKEIQPSISNNTNASNNGDKCSQLTRHSFSAVTAEASKLPLDLPSSTTSSTLHERICMLFSRVDKMPLSSSANFLRPSSVSTMVFV
ncbi:hypothetical protein HK100_010476 [Physocladia obscura]|uniref:Uncharacterized protein n=1 Tax=Physocladia obscura TaxID=109957 RepID=A0AAD5TAI8_9FUNG|nr:hypothetical protein HK100_010476 [Physocladia obscura]